MRDYFRLVKFSHTVFALPFSLVGFFLAVCHPSYSFSYVKLALVLGCMITARNAAMAFNRYADRKIDALNPRTKKREIPAGILSPSGVVVFIWMNIILFCVCCYFLNTLCLLLSPIALIIILGYSYTKRFTWMCHLILGLGLALAPIGSYLAVTGQFDIIPVLYGGAVLTWVAGFDIIYALQDRAFDEHADLYSIPQAIGVDNALRISVLLHLVTGSLLCLAGWFIVDLYPKLDWIHWIGLGIFLVMLVYQHMIVSSKDQSKINMAFFTTNGLASVVFGALMILDLTT